MAVVMLSLVKVDEIYIVFIMSLKGLIANT